MFHYIMSCIIIGPPNGPVLFCSLSSVVVVCNSVGGPGAWAVGRRRAVGRSGGRHCTAGQFGYVPLGRHLVSNASFECDTLGKGNNNILTYD